MNTLLKIVIAASTLTGLSLATTFGTAQALTVKSIKISSAVNNYLQISEVVATETGTGNDLALLSLGATASGRPGSGNWPGSSPNFAINGYAPAYFPWMYHPASGQWTDIEYLLVELADPSTLESISLFGRTDCCSYRDIFNIELFDDLGNSIFTATDLDASGSSHSVTIQLPGDPETVPTPAAILPAIIGLFGAASKRKDNQVEA